MDDPEEMVTLFKVSSSSRDLQSEVKAFPGFTATVVFVDRESFMFGVSHPKKDRANNVQIVVLRIMFVLLVRSVIFDN